MKKLIALTGITALIALTGCGQDTTETPEASTKTEAPTAESNTGTEAKDVTDKLDAYFECDWTKTSDDSDIAVITACESEQLIVITGDPVNVGVVTDNMAEEGQGYAVVADGYTIATPTEAKANTAWDVMGAEGKVERLSK